MEVDTATEEAVAEVEVAVPEAVESVVAEAEPTPDYDEEALFAALLAEEEAAALPETQAEPDPEPELEPVGLSVDALDSLTLDDVIEDYDEAEDELEDEDLDEDMSELLAGLPNLAPDAGKIRFAEDIVGDFRGNSGRRRRAGAIDAAAMCRALVALDRAGASRKP